MENSPILRSLVAGGRSSGTGRPTSSPALERSSAPSDEARNARFEREIRRHEGARSKSSASDGRREDADPKSTERAPVDGDAPRTQPAPNESSEPDDQAAGATSPSQASSSSAANAERSDHAASSAESAPPQSDPIAQAGFELDGFEPAALTNGAELDTGATDLVTASASNPPKPPANTPSANATAADTAQPLVADVSASADQSAAFSDAPQAAVEGPAGLDGAGEAKPAAASLQPDAARAPGESVGAASNELASAMESEPAAPESKTERHAGLLDADTAADVLRQVRVRFTPQMRQALIQLEPRELGRIAIRISVARGVVRAELRAENAAALEALERHTPELTAALERVGLGGEGLAVELGFEQASGDSKGFADFDRRDGSPSAPRPASVALPQRETRALVHRAAAQGGVDTYA